MSKQKLLGLLKEKDQSVEAPSAPNPYSQSDLNTHINNMGFQAEPTPNLSDLAASLNPQNKQLDTKPELANTDTSNALSMVRQHLMNQAKAPSVPSMPPVKSSSGLPINPYKQQIAAPVKQIEPQNKQLNMEALKSIMARRRGK